MKQHYCILGAAIAAALLGTPGVLQAQAMVGSALAGISAHEAQRVTQAVTNSRLVTIPKTHPQGLAQVTSSTPLSGSGAMNHLQLVLKPGALRMAEMQVASPISTIPSLLNFING